MSKNLYNAFLGMELAMPEEIMNLINEYKKNGNLEDEDDWKKVLSYYKEKITYQYLNSNNVFRTNSTLIKNNVFFSTLAFNILPQYLIYFYLLFNFKFIEYERHKDQIFSKVSPSDNQQIVRDGISALGKKYSGNLSALSGTANIENKLKEWMDKRLFHIDEKQMCVSVVGFFPKLEDISEIFFYFTIIFLGMSKDGEYKEVGEELIKIIGSFLGMTISITNQNALDFEMEQS